MHKFLIGLAAAGVLACASAYADKIVLDLKDYDDDLMKDLDRTASSCGFLGYIVGTYLPGLGTTRCIIRL